IRRVVGETERTRERRICAGQIRFRYRFALVEDAVSGARDHLRRELPGQAKARTEVVPVRLHAACRKALSAHRDYGRKPRHEVRLAIVDLIPREAGKHLIAQTPVESERGCELPTVLDEGRVLGTAEATRSAERGDIPARREP